MNEDKEGGLLSFIETGLGLLFIVGLAALGIYVMYGFHSLGLLYGQML